MTDTEMILEQIKNLQEAMEKKFDDMDRKFDEFKSDMHGELGEFKSDMRGELGEFKSDMRGEFNEFKSDMFEEFHRQNETLSIKTAEIDRHLDEVKHDLKIYMENVISQKALALTEGFEIHRDKIAEINRDIRRTQEQYDRLETRVSVLESKTSA